MQIGDFGLAKNNHSKPYLQDFGDLDEHEEDFQKHTSGVGTPTYAAPEQFRDGIIKESSDMYSLGVILFELYCPFSTLMERCKLINDLKRNRTLPRPLLGKYKKKCELIIDLTAENPEHRPMPWEVRQSFEDVDYSSTVDGADDQKQIPYKMKSISKQWRKNRTKDRALRKLRIELKAKDELISKLSLLHQLSLFG